MDKTGEDKNEGKFVKQNDVILPIGSGFTKDGKSDPDTGHTVIKEDKLPPWTKNASDRGLGDKKTFVGPRGFHKDRDDWFEMAHRAIVTKFSEVTNPEVQRRVWLKEQ